MKEVAVVVSKEGEALYWMDGSDSVTIPDSPTLWQFIWENRDKICGIAHTHPGKGTPYPSGTDLTTFRAIEQALGRQLDWWIVSEDEATLVHTVHPEGCGTSLFMAKVSWLPELRRLSYKED
jgi:proteasome lid subunit RPN8/RPN11